MVTRKRKHLNPKHQSFTTVPVWPCWRPAARTRAECAWSFLCLSKENLIPCSPLFSRALSASSGYRCKQDQFQRNIGSFSCLNTRWIPTMSWLLTNRSTQNCAHNRRRTLSPELIRGKKKSFRNCNTQSGLPHAPGLLTKKILTGIESFYWSSLTQNILHTPSSQRLKYRWEACWKLTLSKAGVSDREGSK